MEGLRLSEDGMTKTIKNTAYPSTQKTNNTQIYDKKEPLIGSEIITGAIVTGVAAIYVGEKLYQLKEYLAYKLGY